MKRIRSNKKGYTLLEMMVVMVISIPLVFSMLYVPIELYESYILFNEASDKTSDSRNLKVSLVNDLSGGIANKEENGLKVGESSYRFEDDGVYREGRKITQGKYKYNIEDEYLIIERDSEGGEVIKLSIAPYSYKEARVYE